MISFVIWGTGFRAEAITKFLGEERILAYIDNDKQKQGLSFHNKCIISFEEYLKEFIDTFIIVSPVLQREEVKRQLDDACIYQYFMLDMCPSELLGYGENNIVDLAVSKLDLHASTVLYGDNLYTYLVYEKAKHLGCDAFVCCEDIILKNELEAKLHVSMISQDAIDAGQRVVMASRNYTVQELEKQLNHEVIDIYDLSDDIPEYYNPSMEVFKDVHNGEACFIVATGPSLRIEDLQVLAHKGIKSFGVNRVYNVDSEKWLPDYYMFVDRKGLSDYWDSISSYVAPVKFVEMDFANRFNKQGETFGIHVVTGDAYHGLPKFSENLSRKVYGYATVVYAAIQLAVYMGFKTIYLLGVDCNYKLNSKNNYFFNEDNADSKFHSENLMIDAFIAAKEYADSHGIKIYNATRGGMLEVFERVDFDSLFEE